MLHKAIKYNDLKPNERHKILDIFCKVSFPRFNHSMIKKEKKNRGKKKKERKKKARVGVREIK